MLLTKKQSTPSLTCQKPIFCYQWTNVGQMQLKSLPKLWGLTFLLDYIFLVLDLVSL